jgi:hypothetical protein
MEELKQSEEEVIKLGKKIIKELKFNDTSDTLGKWMSNYIAELLDKIENTKSPSAREKLNKECCELILKVWSHKSNLPRSVQPLSNLQPVLELLKALKNNDHKYPFWRNTDDISKDNFWGNFVSMVRQNSDEIFELSILCVLNKELLSKEQSWLKEHEKSLSVEEKNILEYLNVLIKRGESVISFNDEDLDTFEISAKERYTRVFNKITELIEEQKKELKSIKKRVEIKLSNDE